MKPLAKHLSVLLLALAACLLGGCCDCMDPNALTPVVSAPHKAPVPDQHPSR